MSYAQSVVEKISPAYSSWEERQQLNYLLVKWEKENEVSESRFDQIEHMLEEPNVDLITSILILAQLGLMQSTAFIIYQKHKQDKQWEKLQAYKNEYYNFIEISTRLSDAEASMFDKLESPNEGEEFKSWFEKIRTFYNDAFSISKKIEGQFFELVDDFLGGSGVDNATPHIIAAFSSISDNVVDDTFSNRGAFIAYKKMEQFIAKLLVGTAAEIVIPGAINVTKGMFEIRSAFSQYLYELHNASRKKMEALIRREESFFNLAMDAFEKSIDNFAIKQLENIRQIIENYYRATLNIIDRLRV